MIQNTSSTMQLKILLRNVTKPPVWRRVLIPSDLARQKTAAVLGTIRSQKDSGEADDPKYSDLGESDADVRHYRSLMHSGEEMWDREYKGPGDPHEADDYYDDEDDRDETDDDDMEGDTDFDELAYTYQHPEYPKTLEM